MRHRCLPILLPVISLMAACASAPAVKSPPPPKAQVSYHAVADADAPRYHVDPAQVAIEPTTGSRNHAPVYPLRLVLLKLPPVQVRAKLVVDATGHVTRALIAGETTADANTQVFDAAIRQAVLHWTFDPLRMTTWKDLPDGSSQRVADQPMPFSQDYVFRFEIRHGKPVVSAAAPTM